MGLPEIAVLQRYSLATLVRGELEAMIARNEIRAGQKLSESALAARLGVSRGPLRESFRALQESGLVRIEKNRGVFVREIALEEAIEIGELWGAIVRRAGMSLALSITVEQMSELCSICLSMSRTAAGNVDEHLALALRFHDSMVDYAGNARMLRMHRRLTGELNLFDPQWLVATDRVVASTRDHQRILDAIASGDPDSAGRALARHAAQCRSRLGGRRGLAALRPVESARTDVTRQRVELARQKDPIAGPVAKAMRRAG